MPKRNDPCHCGSGKKYKHCHMKEDRESGRPRQLVQRSKKSARIQPEPEPEQLDPEAQRLKTLFDSFSDAEYDEQLAIVRTEIEEQVLDEGLAFEFFNVLHGSMNLMTTQEQRKIFMELVALLKTNQPDAYAANANWFWSWEIKNALVLNDQEMLQESTDELIKNGGQSLDEFYRAYHALLYYDCRKILLSALGKYTIQIDKDKHFPDVDIELNLALCDLIIMNYIETHESGELLDERNIEALCADLNKYSEDIALDGLTNFVSWAGGLRSNQWSTEDFRLAEQKVPDSSWHDDEKSDDKSDSAANLRHLSLEFLHYARHTEYIPLTKANMARVEIVNYILERQRGNLSDAGPADGSKRRKNAPKPHILIPEHGTLDSYLMRFYGFLANRTYQGAAFFDLIPTWARFLHTKGLVREEEVAQISTNLSALKQALTRRSEQGSDPMLAATMRAWGENISQ